MIFSIILFLTSWILFIILGNKKRFVEIAPTGYVAVILALITDLLMKVYPIWEYPSSSKLELFSKEISNAFGIYFVVTYLFIQMLPSKKTMKKLVIYIFYWSTFSLGIEILSLFIGYIEHHYWWNLGFSYLSDWILFFTFYFHHILRESFYKNK